MSIQVSCVSCETQVSIQTFIVSFFFSNPTYIWNRQLEVCTAVLFTHWFINHSILPFLISFVITLRKLVLKSQMINVTILKRVKYECYVFCVVQCGSMFLNLTSSSYRQTSYVTLNEIFNGLHRHCSYVNWEKYYLY